MAFSHPVNRLGTVIEAVKRCATQKQSNVPDPFRLESRFLTAKAVRNDNIFVGRYRGAESLP